MAAADAPLFMQVAHADLMQAVEASSIPDINRAVARGADINATDPEGRLPLRVAASNGNLEVVNRLLHLAADASVKGADGHTALWSAAAAGHEAVVKRLLLWGGMEADELAAAAIQACNDQRMRIAALILRKLSQVNEERCTAVLQQLQNNPQLSQRLDQAIMQAWLADTTNHEQQQQAALQEHQALVDAQRHGMEQLLVRVADMARAHQPHRPRGP